LTLDDAIARVAQYHPDLRLAEAQRPIWEARRDAAGLRPPLTVGVDLENVLGSGDASGVRSAELTVTLAGMLERGGKLDARRARADFLIAAESTAGHSRRPVQCLRKKSCRDCTGQAIVFRSALQPQRVRLLRDLS
jgi:hypothetical protein